MDMQVKNRGWVKNAAIIFLVILLILTFFSNTWMNRSLAEVATQTVTSGSVTARVRGTGTVTATGAYEVKAPSTREIRSVMVRVGQEVNQGDVLFVLGEGSSEELEAATENLRQLQLSYQRSALGMPSYDYSMQERELEAAQEQLDAAIEAEEAARAALQEGSVVPESQLKMATLRLEEAQNGVAAAKTALTEAQEAFTQKQEDAQQRVDAALARLNELLDAAPAAETAAPEETTAPAADEEKTEYERQLEEAQAALSAAQLAQAALDSSTDSRILAAQQDLEDAQTAQTQAQAALDELLNLSGDAANAYNQAAQARKELEDHVFELEYSLNQQKIANGKSAASASLDLQDLSYQIEKAKKTLEELSGGEENQITANVSGVIETINYTAGNTAPKGETLCSIQVPDMGYTLSFSVTNEQAQRLRLGDSADVNNYYWGRTINASLSGIRTDPQNPQTSKLLTFDVSGDVNPGSELTVSVGQKSQNYDVIVPNSSVRSDSNGSFVLAIEAKNSPLGNRYYARRVEVTVLASDDVNSAVSGDLGYGDFVITTSNRPVKSGDMVRMAD